MTLDEMLSGKLAPNMKQYLAVFQNDTIPQAYGISGQGLSILNTAGEVIQMNNDKIKLNIDRG